MQFDRKIVTGKHRQVDRQTDGPKTERQADRQVNRQTHTKIDRQTNRQAGRNVDTQPKIRNYIHK